MSRRRRPDLFDASRRLAAAAWSRCRELGAPKAIEASHAPSGTGALPRLAVWLDGEGVRG